MENSETITVTLSDEDIKSLPSVESRTISYELLPYVDHFEVHIFDNIILSIKPVFKVSN